MIRPELPIYIYYYKSCVTLCLGSSWLLTPGVCIVGWTPFVWLYDTRTRQTNISPRRRLIVYEPTWSSTQVNIVAGISSCWWCKQYILDFWPRGERNDTFHANLICLFINIVIWALLTFDVSVKIATNLGKKPQSGNCNSQVYHNQVKVETVNSLGCGIVFSVHYYVESSRSKRCGGISEYTFSSYCPLIQASDRVQWANSQSPVLYPPVLALEMVDRPRD